MKNRYQTTARLTLMALLIALLIVLGYVNIPQPAGLSITFNMIPVAIAAIALGVKGGAIIGGVFGIISFLQCFGLIGYSAMGAALLNVSPVLTFIHRFVSRLLVGILTALIYRYLKSKINIHITCILTGFSAALLNTVFFMSMLVLLFSNTAYMQEQMAGRGMIAYLVASIGINALVEMIVAAVVTGAVGVALKRARLIKA